MSQKISLTFGIALALNWLVFFILILAILGFLSFQNVYGLFLASVTALIALGIFKHKAWGYFAAAAWGLACFQLAKQGYEFQPLKREVMTIGFIIIPVSIFLHEILAKRNDLLSSEKNKASQKSAPRDEI